MPSTTQSIALKISAVLWLIWGLVHILAGVLTISGDPSTALAGIADAVDPAALKMEYHPAAGAIVNQHGWNLAWGGLTTVVCAPFIWRAQAWAIFLAALVGGLLDVGYFLFLDLGGHVNFVPGTVMTIVSGTAIVLSFWAHFGAKKAS